MPKVTPFLWYDSQAEEAANFYTSIFPNSKVLEISRYSDVGPGPSGSVMTVRFMLDGEEFLALNGGPHFTFNESISFVISCSSQDEVDHFWERLTEGGEESQCGWLKDRYGLSWQVVPDRLPQALQDPDPERARRAMQAMLSMRKLDIGAIERAARGEDEPAGS